MDVLKEIVVPHLLVSIRSKGLTQDERLEMVMVLTAYAVKAEREEVFVKALDGVDAKQIMSRNDLKQFVSVGCGLFKSQEVSKLCAELEAAKESTPVPAQ